MSRWFDALIGDLRQAYRTIRANTRGTLLVITILAVAIGGSTIVFSIVEIMLLPSVIGNTERLGWVFGIDTRRANDRAGVSMPDFLDFRDRTQAFESLAARATGTLTLTGHGQASRLSVMYVTWDHLDVWALNAVRGRTFQKADSLPGAPRVVVLSHRMWQAKLAGDESVVGNSVILNGVPQTVIGVLDPRIDVGAFSTLDAWALLDPGAGRSGPRDRRVLSVVGLLKKGISVEQASREIETVALQLQTEYPTTNGGWDARVVNTRIGRTAPQTYYNLGLLSVGAALVLLIACVNVASLLLARGIARQGELSIRLALGANPSRIVRPQIFEGVLVAVPAVIVGLALALCVIVPLKNSTNTYYQRIPIDWTLFAFSSAVSLVIPTIFGVLPALRLFRRRARLTASEWAERRSGSVGRLRQRALAMTQLAAALTLLLVAGLVLRSLAVSIRSDTGFMTRDLLSVALDLPLWKYPQHDQLPRLFSGLVGRVAELPDVSNAAAVSSIPAVQPPGAYMSVILEGMAVASEADRPSGQVVTVTPNAFATLQVPVLAGREFSIHDKGDSLPVALVNQQFAQRYGPAPANVLGRRLTVGVDGAWRQIVGVVGNTRVFSKDGFPPFIYLPHAQNPQRTMFLLARMPGHVSATAVTHAVAATDPDVAPYQIRTIDEALRSLTSSQLILFGLFGGLAAVAALLSTFGLFGVYSCLVAQRKQELGVRLALGATQRDLAWLIFAEGFGTMIPAVVIGSLGGALLSRYAVGVIYGVTADPYDPVVYVACVVLLLGAGVAALWTPAQHAKHVSVTELLRS